MYKNYMKRIVDFTIAFITLFLAWPLFAILIIWLHFANKESGIFFYQERPGKNGKIFQMIKFKSMTDAKNAQGHLLPNELRITPAGAFIRKTSIDELPQLLNVLKGDMSIVGPRPLRVEYLPLYSSTQARRHEVRPGITGWAQVNGRNSIAWTKKFEMDVWYVDHVSLWLDLKIIHKTVMKVLKRTDINADSDSIGTEKFNGHN